MSEDNQEEKLGIYTGSLIADWFSVAYIQSYVDNSYSFITKSLCQDCFNNLQQEENRNFFRNQLSKLPSLIPPKFWLGWNIQHIGGICSIMVIAFLIIRIVIFLITLILKFLLLNQAEVRARTTVARALCSEFYLISKANDDVKNHTNPVD